MMRKFMGLLAIGLLLDLGGTGCSTVKKDEQAFINPNATKVKFEADSTSAVLDGKDRSRAVNFTRNVGSVSEAREGVSAVVSGNKVVFTQTGASPYDDRKVDFLVRGAEGDDSVTVSITLARRPAADVELEKESLEIIVGNAPVMRAFVGIKAGRAIIQSTAAEGKNAVTAHVVEDKILVRALNTALPGNYLFKITSAEEKKGAELKVRVKTAESFELDDDGKLELKLVKNAGKDMEVLVKARMGTIVGVAPLAPEGAKVRWKYHEDRKAIAITVARDAVANDAREYEVRVRGRDSTGKSAMVKLKFKVASDDGAALETANPK